jgi:4-amino-4-deoxy-L-arabinose transferase-like glycosyltransferase
MTAKRHTWHDLIALALLAIAAFGLMLQLRHNTITSDEVIYAPAGLRYILKGDLIINSEHPPLTKLIAGVAVLMAHPRTALAFESNEQWRFGQLFWFESGNQTDQLLFLSRLPFALFTWLLLVWIYAWVAARFGKLAGLVSLAMLALNPVIIAHGTLTTSDMFLGITAWSVVVASVWLVEKPSKLAAVFWGVSLAGLVLGKFSGPILVPFAVLPVVIGLLLMRRDWLKHSLLLGISLLVAGGLIWSTYAFIERDVVLSRAPVTVGLVGHEIKLSGWPVKQLVLPFLRYAQGMSEVEGHNALGHAAYLNGKISQSGFRSYFVWALWYKTPIIILALLLLGAAYALARRQLLLGMLAVTSGIFLLIASLGHIDIGIRHVAVIYVLLAPGAGFLAESVLTTQKFLVQKMIGVSLLLALVLDVWLGGGLTFGYFSTLSGGVRDSYRHLADSNIDWGQDLNDMAKFVTNHQISRPIFFNTTGEDPSYRRFEYVSMEDKSCSDLAKVDWIIVTTNILVGLRGNYSCLLERVELPTTYRISQSAFAFRGSDLAFSQGSR